MGNYDFWYESSQLLIKQIKEQKFKMAKKNLNNINVQMFTQLKVAEKSKVPVFFIGAFFVYFINLEIKFSNN